MLNGLFIVGQNSDILLQKEFLSFKIEWRPDTFVSLLKNNNNLPPCVLLKGLYFMHLSCESIYFVAVTEDQTASPIIICEYLEGLAELFKNFLGTVSTDSILKNIGLAYEIICETIDAGCPKLMKASKLKPLLCNAVTLKPKSSDILSLIPNNLFGVVEKEEKEVSGDASAKPVYNREAKDAKKADELYVDLIEKLSVIINADGSTAYCNVQGKLNIKSYLDNQAVVMLSFPHCIDMLSHVVFNSSVSVDDQSKKITATVSPGSLEVLSYCTPDLGKDISLPFTMYVNVTPTVSDKMILLTLRLYCALPISNPAVNLVGKITLPRSVLAVTGSSSLKNITFHQDKTTNDYVFSCPIFPGSSHHSIFTKIYLSSWTPAITLEMTNVTLQFEVPMFCHSYMKISDLKIDRTNLLLSNKPINKWVRYLTFARSYEFRINDEWFQM